MAERQVVKPGPGDHAFQLNPLGCITDEFMRFVEKHPALVARLNSVFAAEGRWADTHHEEVAKAQADATGVDIEAVRRFVDRSNFRVVPIDDEVIKSQQAVADRFAKLGLIPRPVDVSDIVWKWTPGS